MRPRLMIRLTGGRWDAGGSSSWGSRPSPGEDSLACASGSYDRPVNPRVDRTLAIGPRPSLSLALVGGRGVHGGSRRGCVEAAEDHPPGAGLEDAGDGQADGLAEVIGPLLGDDH